MRARASAALVLLTLGAFLVRVCPSSADDRSASFGGGHPSSQEAVSQERDVWGAAVDAPCSPEAPCVHLVPHTHLDPGWRDTFEGYHRSFASRIHPSVVLALAADHRKRFAFADISFLARWLEESGDARVPSTCAYDPRRPTSPRDVTVLDASWRPERRGARAAKAFAAEKTACPETWSALCRRLVREGRLDVVGGGWVSHDEATTPVDLAAAQYDEGMRTVRALFFEEQTDRRFDGDDEFADADVAEASATAWQIDPFGHAAATPAILAHLGFERVVLNRVPAATRARLIRENAREFTWTSRDASESASDSAAPRERSVAAHVLRAHYNVPPELDFERRRVVLNADGTLRADLVRLAAAALLKTAEAASQGVRHGHALVLVGDDFRFADAAATFDAWRDALAGAEKSFPRAARKRDAVSCARRVGPERLEPETEPSAPRFRWSTPREYFAAANAATRALAPPTRRGAFFPYADNFPASENAWVGGYVARRALKDAVLEAATSAVVASSLAASLPRAEEGSNASRGFAANLARDVRAARRDGFLGLHHDAITGTCPAHVAEDTFRIASRAVTASRRAIRAAATVALECDEEPVADVAEDASDASGVPFLARGGDAFAVHNPRGDAAGAAVVTVRVARGLALVDARDAESARRRTPLPTQSAFGPGKGDARGDDGDASVVVVAAPPPLGVTVVVAVDRASLETEASRSGLADAGASAREPTSALRPEDMGVAFDATGATISFTAGNGEKVFARLSAASVAFPRDEHFGDGPYVSRSAAAHVFVVWVGSVLGYVVGDCVARCVLAARARATGKTASRRGAFFTQRKQRRRREDGVVRSFFVSLASRSRRRSALRGSRGTRVDEVDDAPAFMSDDDDDDDPKKKEDGSRSRRTSTFGANDVDRFGEARVACAFAVGAAFPLFVWSPGLVSHVAYRALLDAGLKGTGAFLTVGAPFGAVARGARALGAPAARIPRSAAAARGARGGDETAGRLVLARVSVARESLSLAAAATCGFLLVAVSAPWLDARPLLARDGAEPACRRGAVFSECALAYGGGGGADAREPSARLVVRDVFVDGDSSVPQRRVEWVATAPSDSEIVARVAWRVGKDAETRTDTKVSALFLDDGVGGHAVLRPPKLLDAFRKGWSVAARSAPSGRFVAFELGRREGRNPFSSSSSPRRGNLFGIVFERAGSSAFLGPSFATFGVHRNALSDDGHGLGAHEGQGRAGRRDLSDARPGRLAFRLVAPRAVLSEGFEQSEGSGTLANVSACLRRVAAAVARPPVAVRVPRRCGRASWSPLAQPAPFETRVLQTDAAEREDETNASSSSCALRFRVQNIGSGAMTADGLARAVGGDVAMDPPTVMPGGLAYARWDRAC